MVKHELIDILIDRNPQYSFWETKWSQQLIKSVSPNWHFIVLPHSPPFLKERKWNGTAISSNIKACSIISITAIAKRTCMYNYFNCNIRELQNNHPQALGSGPWLFSALKKFWLCPCFWHKKKWKCKNIFFTMAAKTSTTLRVFPTVSFNFKVFYPVVLSDGKWWRVWKSWN